MIDMKFQRVEIACPGCGRALEVEFNVLDLTINRDTVRDVSCEDCGVMFMVKPPWEVA